VTGLVLLQEQPSHAGHRPLQGAGFDLLTSLIITYMTLSFKHLNIRKESYLLLIQLIYLIAISGSELEVPSACRFHCDKDTPVKENPLRASLLKVGRYTSLPEPVPYLTLQPESQYEVHMYVYSPYVFYMLPAPTGRWSS